MDSDGEKCMIFVLGETGSGKSHFINQLVSGAVEESDDIYSGTITCKMVPMELGDNRTVAVVDTPGFNDSHRSDEQILGEIANFLIVQYQLGVKLKGIIYLHRITDPKMSGSARRYREIFELLCGPRALGNVTLVTTQWHRLTDPSEGYARQQRLRDVEWHHMIEHNSTVVPFRGGPGAARVLVMDLAAKPDVVLKIQEELIIEGKKLSETGVARHFLDESKNASSPSMNSGPWNQQSSSQKVDEKERAKVRRRRKEELNAPVERTKENMKKVPKEWWRGKFKDSLQLFIAIIGLTGNIVINVVLPLCGVGF